MNVRNYLLPFVSGLPVDKTLSEPEVFGPLDLARTPKVCSVKILDWQWHNRPSLEAEFHRGLQKIILVNSGWLWTRSSTLGGELCPPRLVMPDEQVTLAAAEQHVLLPGPSSVLTVILFGMMVTNPTRGDQDRWPVDDQLKNTLLNLKQKDILDLINQRTY